MALRATRARAGDHSSFAEPASVVVRHTALQLDVDFGTKLLQGYAALSVEVLAPQQRLTLDTRDLTVHAVELQPAGSALAFSLGEPHKALGTPLHIELPEGCAAGSKLEVGIRYTCSPAASALQWLEPSQTAGGRHPYLFTQCQAIHARSLLPCQDTPSVKSTYSAAVRVPAPLTALMSAVGGAGHRVFMFHQKVPIPSYLIALAVGELESRELSDRSRVWSEPSVVDAAAYEFAETAKFLDTGEALAGPYRFGRYDLLLLPPSFPYGGMENPCLTFVTPTLLAGDRSLTNVVAHEAAHSWTGNLVTNASWEHFWLNEGWTVFLERKIVGRLQGEAVLQFQAAQGAASLAEEVARLGPDHNFTRLVPDLSGGEDPDDAFSRIPYEKGFYFLYYLQGLVGGPDAFEPYMRAYLDAFANSTVTSDQFREAFSTHFADCPAVADIDWDTWLYAPGMPPVKVSYDTSLATSAYDLALRWHTSDVMGVGSDPPPGASAADIAGWGSEQVVAFLDRLAELRSMTPLAAPMARALAAAYGLDAATNCEIRAAWYKLGIAAGDAAVYPGVADLLRSQGRMKYLRPLYRALFRAGGDARRLALDTFAAARGSYHPIAAKMVAADLGLRGE